MNISEYNSDPRYWAVWEKMQLLGIEDVSTKRQEKNGTIVWRLPIKNHNNRNPSYIEVASFSTGYVRNQNSGYSNYQLNKRCDSEPQYYGPFENGLYRKYITRACKLIPIEIDRLEYLISYCLKNYYIKRANQVVEGKYVSQWYHDWSLENANSPTVTRNLKKIGELHDKLEKVKRECNQAYECGLSDGKTKANETYSENIGAMAKINDLEEKLDAMTEARDYWRDNCEVADNKLSNAISPTKYEVEKTYSVNLEHELHNLQNKLATIERIANDRNKWNTR